MFSINKNIHNCKVRAENANRNQSERIFNPSAMICPVWTNQDDLGRFVTKDSRKLYTAGCNSANDIVETENYLYASHINQFNLNSYGIDGSDLYK